MFKNHVSITSSVVLSLEGACVSSRGVCVFGGVVDLTHRR